MASHSFGHQRSWGTFSYTVFWCILFDWATLCVPVYWVDASFSCQEHGFSDKAQKRTSLDAKLHEAWIWGFTMDLPCFTSVREICHVGNIWKRRHSGTWHWESSGLNNVIPRLREVHARISVCWYLKIFNHINNVFYGSHDRCLENPSLCYLMLLARAVCILVPEWSVQWYDLIQETDFGSLESYISKTIRPTWATSCLLLSSLRGCCVALSSVTRSFQVVLVLSNAKICQGSPAPWYLRFSGIKAGDFEHLKPKTLLAVYNPMIRIAFHATETRNQGLLNANCRWLCVALDMDDLFLGVDVIAPCALCHTCANSESTMSSAAVSYSFTCDWEHSRLSHDPRSTIYHKFSGFPNERSRTSSVLLRCGRVQHGPTLNWAWFLFDLWKNQDNWWHRRSESRCPNGAL